MAAALRIRPQQRVDALIRAAHKSPEHVATRIRGLLLGVVGEAFAQAQAAVLTKGEHGYKTPTKRGKYYGNVEPVAGATVPVPVLVRQLREPNGRFSPRCIVKYELVYSPNKIVDRTRKASRAMAEMARFCTASADNGLPCSHSATAGRNPAVKSSEDGSYKARVENTALFLDIDGRLAHMEKAKRGLVAQKLRDNRKRLQKGLERLGKLTP